MLLSKGIVEGIAVWGIFGSVSEAFWDGDRLIPCHE